MVKRKKKKNEKKIKIELSSFVILCTHRCLPYTMSTIHDVFK